MRCPRTWRTALVLVAMAGAAPWIRAQHAVVEEAHALIAQGRAVEAVTRLEAARRATPDDRVILQALIRAHAAQRSVPWAQGGAAQPHVTTNPPVTAAAPPRSGPCWTRQLQAALEACAHERATAGESAELLERIGDVHRSLGQVGPALAAWRRSAELAPAATSAQRKAEALAAFAGNGAAPVVARANVPPAGATPLRVNEPQARLHTAGPQASLQTVHPQPSPQTVHPQPSLQTVHPQASLQSVHPQPSLRVAAPVTASPVPARAAYDATANPALAEGRALALVIGIDRYRDHAPLLTAVADVRLVGELLRERYGFVVETVENATRRQVLDALAQLRKRAGANDRVLVYYAGHGVQDDATGRGYWLPADAERDNVANWVSNGDVADMLQGMSARHALVVADSCFAATLARGAGEPRPDARPDALQRLAARRSRAVLASGGLEPVLDSGAGRHSLFARALVDVLAAQGEAVEAGRVFAAVRDRMVRVADQTPQYAAMHDAGHEGGEFIFTPVVATAAR